MEVLCIKDGQWMGFFSKKPLEGPVFGEKCKVVETKNNTLASGILAYVLLEYPTQTGGYSADCFVPLSNIDEREFEREEYKEKEVL